MASKPQLLSTSSGQTNNLLSTSVGQTYNLLSTSAGLSQANNSTNIIGLSSIAGWSLYPAISTINAAGNNIVNIKLLSTLDLQVSSINGAEFTITSSIVIIQGVTITNNTVKAGQVEKTKGVTDYVNEAAGAVGAVVDVAQKVVSGALADTGTVLQQVYWGTAAVDAVIDATNGVVNLATGIQGLVNSRSQNSISGGNVPGQTVNVYETFNGTTQFQFSTLGSPVTSVFRTTNQKNPALTLGSEIFTSSIIRAGSKAVRSVSDPYSMAIISTQILSTTNYLQSFGQWHAILEPDYGLSTFGLTNIGTFSNLGNSELNGIVNIYGQLNMEVQNITGVNTLFTNNIKNTGILSNLTFCNVGDAYFVNTGTTYFQKPTIFSYDASFSGANLQMAGNSISNINNLNANYANIIELEVSSLKASTVNVKNIIDNFVSTTSAELDTAKISSIFANYAAISSISSQTIFTPTFSSLQAYLSSFRSDTGFITRLSSLQGYISSFQSDTALIPNLSTGTITGLDKVGNSSNTVSFSYTGSDQFWTAPAGVNYIDINMIGACGGFCNAAGFQNPGLGGVVSGRLNVVPGTTYTIIIGQAGGVVADLGLRYGGGGRGYYSGGGRTAIALNNDDLATAGGGGAGSYTSGCSGGDGGGDIAADGLGPPFAGGGGGSFLKPGIGGQQLGADGSKYQGGTAAGTNGAFAGGGGGGFNGGGGGGYNFSTNTGGGGGGGCSYVQNLYFNVVNTRGGGRIGRNGSMTITTYQGVFNTLTFSTQQVNMTGNMYIDGDLSGVNNLSALYLNAQSARISSLVCSTYAGPSTINFSVFPSTNVFTVNKKSINTFVFGISQSYNGNNINGTAVIKDGNNNQFKISEWACSLALQGVYEFAGLHTASAFNYIDTHLIDYGGVWGVFFNVYANVDRSGNNGAINWDVTMTPLELTQVQPAGFSALPLNSTITLSTVTYNYPNTFLSTLLASTLTISAIENISLNANTAIPTFLGNGNVALNANSNIDFMANYDIIAGAGHDITATASHTISLTANDIALHGAIAALGNLEMYENNIGNVKDIYLRRNLIFQSTSTYIADLGHIYGNTSAPGGGLGIDYMYGLFFNSAGNNANLYCTGGFMYMTNFSAGIGIEVYNPPGTGDSAFYVGSNDLYLATGTGHNVITNSGSNIALNAAQSGGVISLYTSTINTTSLLDTNFTVNGNFNLTGGGSAHYITLYNAGTSIQFAGPNIYVGTSSGGFNFNINVAFGSAYQLIMNGAPINGVSNIYFNNGPYIRSEIPGGFANAFLDINGTGGDSALRLINGSANIILRGNGDAEITSATGHNIVLNGQVVVNSNLFLNNYTLYNAFELYNNNTDLLLTGIGRNITLHTYAGGGINLNGPTTVNDNINMNNHSITNVSTFSRVLGGTTLAQPIMQWGATTGSGTSGSTTVTIPQAYTDAGSYIAFAIMQDSTEAKIAVNRNSANSITIVWSEGGSGSQTLAWQTVGT